MGRVECEFKYSGATALAIAGAAAATAAVVVLTPLAWTVRSWVLAALCLSAGEAIQRVAMHRGPRGVRAMRLAGGRDIQVRRAGGGWIPGSVCDGSFVAPWLTIVLWRPAGARRDHAIVILPGMMRADDFRRLRVLLRWG